MSKRKRNRLYSRNQGGEARYYGDFRDYADVGGGREALIPDGADRATTDERLAQLIVGRRLAELEERRRRKETGAPESDTYLSEYVGYHLELKRQSGNVTPQWLDAARKHLGAAVSYFCGPQRDRELGSITVAEVQRYVAWLASQGNGRGGSFSPSNQRKYLNSLSNLFRRAISERRVPPGHNPVAALLDKPQEADGRGEARWLEVDAAAAFLAAARAVNRARRDLAVPPSTLYALVGTMLLTGGRPSEVLGLETADVCFERRIVTFRPNATRTRLKTVGSLRSVPLWPQLEEILREYGADGRVEGPGVPLFPSERTGQRIVDIRKALDAVATSIGWPVGCVRPYAFRHTYCAARLQTLDRGAPVSVYTVAREMGHGGFALVNRVYGHLGSVRHRSEVVEYRVPPAAEEVP